MSPDEPTGERVPARVAQPVLRLRFPSSGDSGGHVLLVVLADRGARRGRSPPAEGGPLKLALQHAPWPATSAIDVRTPSSTSDGRRGRATAGADRERSRTSYPRM